jgi:hypothetical protein
VSWDAAPGRPRLRATLTHSSTPRKAASTGLPGAMMAVAADDRSGAGASPNSAVHHSLGRLEDDMWGPAVESGAKGDLVFAVSMSGSGHDQPTGGPPIQVRSAAYSGRGLSVSPV